MRNYKSLLETLGVAIFMLLALELVIFPGLESQNIVVNLISLVSFCLLVIFVIASVPIGNNTEE